MNTRVSTRKTAAPSATRAPMAEVASIILPSRWRERLVRTPSLSALSWNSPEAMHYLRPVVVDNWGRAAGTAAAPGAPNQAVVGEALFERLRAHVRNDAEAIQYTECLVQEVDHLQLVQRTWDLRVGGVYALLSPFVLAGKPPTGETLALLCERYGEPVLAWCGDADGVEFVRLFDHGGAIRRTKEAVH